MLPKRALPGNLDVEIYTVDADLGLAILGQGSPLKEKWNFSNGATLKLDALQKLAIVLVIVGTLFDAATTEVLLQAGSVQRGEYIISFSEANPLFHILGKDGFIAVYVVITILVIALILFLPRIVRSRTACQVGLMVLSAYGVAHLVLGIRNYQIIQTYLL